MQTLKIQSSTTILPPLKKPKVVMLLSGGIDSATLAYLLNLQGHEIYALTIDYGQKHNKEIICARDVASSLNQKRGGTAIHWELLDFSVLQNLLKSALTTEEPIPEGHYEADSMKATVVPNRNAILLNIAAGYALSIGAIAIAYAAHAGDHAIYPDCRPDFVFALEEAIQIGTDSELRVYAPFIHMHKADIIKQGLQLGVPYELTWSCYKGGDKACGKCGTCVERLEAFELNGVRDPIEYEER